MMSSVALLLKTTARIALVVLVVMVGHLQAGTVNFETAAVFPVTGDTPVSGLVSGSDGNFYGTTSYGGGGEYGTVFKMTPDGTCSVIVNFTGTNGSVPYGSLVSGTDGNFYGTTTGGGSGGDLGTVFKVTPGGTLSTLVSFTGTNGSVPYGSLVSGSDGNFYGTTTGAGSSFGTVFKITPSGTLSTLVTFSGTNGSSPNGSLVSGTDGNFYGTTAGGGIGNNGTVFKVTTGGTLSTLVIFTGTNGSAPKGGLVSGSDGNFYGTTTGGGSGNNGTVFRMTPAGTLSTLVNFTGADGSVPRGGLVSGSDGNFYGTTTGGGSFSAGTAFKMTAGGTLSTLVSFTGTNGSSPNGDLVSGSDGNFYGTTGFGGNGNSGTVFKMTPAGTITILVNLQANPYAQAPVEAADGNFFGTTSYVGSINSGAVYKMTPVGTLSTLVGFTGTNGLSPNRLVSGTDGSFYGTTSGGGTSNFGTVFRVTASGTLSTLVSFTGANGRAPFGRLVSGTDGNFYGTTQQGGSSGFGTVFKMTTGGSLSTLVNFTGSNGRSPYGSLISDANGTFYGTTYGDGASNFGTVFTISSSGTFSTLVSFTGTNGTGPVGSLVFGADGNLYGTTSGGGSGNNGTVFKLTPGGTLSTLVAFTGTNGRFPEGSLIRGNDGNFYGATRSGGVGDRGTVFKMTPDGTLTTIWSFTGQADGEFPSPDLFLADDGNIYGANNISVFRLRFTQPFVTLGTPSGVTPTKATLNATVNPNGIATKVSFSYGTTTSYGHATVARTVRGLTNSVFSAGITGLSPGTTYHYSIFASGSGGTFIGADQTFTTPSAPPSVTTGAASGITFLSATTSGLVNPNRFATSVAFDYGTTKAYGKTTAAQPVASGTTNVAITAGITGLSAGAIYHYRIVASSTMGTTYGVDRTFTTANSPPVVATGTASNISFATANANGTVTSNGFSTSIGFNYGLTIAYGHQTTRQIVSGSANGTFSGKMSGLASDTIYHFQIVAKNSGGTAVGADQTFTTADEPPVVATGTVSGVTFISATASATVNPNKLSTTVIFKYGKTNAYGLTSGSQVIASGTSAVPVRLSLSGLSPATTYHYQVVATNSGGTTNGIDRTFTTADPPPVVTTGTAAAVSTASATVSGTVNSNGLSTSVYFNYGTTTVYGLKTRSQAVSGSTSTPFSTAITGLTPGIVYHFQIVAKNSGGTAVGADQTFTTSDAAPSVSTGAASAVTFVSATASGMVNPNSLSTAVIFRYGKTNTYGLTTGTQVIATGTSSVPVSLALSGLAPATVYHYQIVGTNSVGTTHGSDRTFTTAHLPPTITTDAAAEPASVSATATGEVNANGLSTTVVFNYGNTNAYGLKTGGKVIGSKKSPVKFSTGISELLPSTTYHFQLVAISTSGTTVGADHTFTTAGPPPVVTTGTAIAVSFVSATAAGMVNPNGLSTTVTFNYGTTSNYGLTTVAHVIASGTSSVPSSALISGLLPSTTYHYQIVATSSVGTAYGTDQTFTTANPPPIVTAASATGVSLLSATVIGTVNPNGLATTVSFSYGQTKSYGLTTVAQVIASGTSAVTFSAGISGLAPSTTYHYQIVATNSSGTTLGADQTFTTALPPPLATTGTTTSITSNSAETDGTVNPNGLATTVSFNYGPTTAYGSKTTAEPVGSGTITVPFSAQLAGLASGTLYHFQIVATNSSGTTVGADQTFTTFPTGRSVPRISAITISGTTGSGGDVEATVNPQGEDAMIHFEYGLTASYGLLTDNGLLPARDTDAVLFLRLVALAPHTTYHVRCVAQNDLGTTVSADATFRTLPRFDINRDGFSDLLLLDPSTGASTVMFIHNGRHSGKAVGPQIPENLVFCGAGDFNHDGTTGWVFLDGTSRQIQVWTMTEATQTGTTTGPTIPADSEVAGVADMNADGYPDLILINTTTQQTSIWLLDTSLNVTAKLLGPTLPPGFIITAVDDFNGDQKPDLQVWQPSTRLDKILTMNGANLVSMDSGPRIPRGWRLVGANVYKGGDSPSWLLYSPKTHATKIWTMAGSKRTAVLKGPKIPKGFTILETK